MSKPTPKILMSIVLKGQIDVFDHTLTITRSKNAVNLLLSNEDTGEDYHTTPLSFTSNFHCAMAFFSLSSNILGFKLDSCHPPNIFRHSQTFFNNYWKSNFSADNPPILIHQVSYAERYSFPFSLNKGSKIPNFARKNLSHLKQENLKYRKFLSKSVSVQLVAANQSQSFESSHVPERASHINIQLPFQLSLLKSCYGKVWFLQALSQNSVLVVTVTQKKANCLVFSPPGFNIIIKFPIVYPGTPQNIAFSENKNQLLVSSQSDGHIKVYNIKNGRSEISYNSVTPLECINAIAISKNNLAVLTSSGQTRLLAFDSYKNGQSKLVLSKTFKSHHHASAIAFSLDGQYLYIGNKNGDLACIEADSGDFKWNATCHSDSILEIYPTTHFLFLPSENHTIAKFFPGTKTTITWYKGFKASVTSCIVIGQCLVGASKDNTVQIFDWETGKLLQTLKDHSGSVGCLATNNLQFLYTGCDDGYLRVYVPSSQGKSSS